MEKDADYLGKYRAISNKLKKYVISIVLCSRVDCLLFGNSSANAFKQKSVKFGTESNRIYVAYIIMGDQTGVEACTQIANCQIVNRTRNGLIKKNSLEFVSKCHS